MWLVAWLCFSRPVAARGLAVISDHQPLLFTYVIDVNMSHLPSVDLEL